MSERPTAPPGGSLREPLTFLVLALVCLACVATLKPDADADLGARLAVGKLIVESGSVTVHDPFSYTPKRPEWIDHEWGAGVVFYLIAAWAGQKGLLLLKAGLMFGTILFMYLRARRDTGIAPSLIFHVLLVVFGLTFGFLSTVRAQAFTFFLFSAWLYLLERARDGDWRLAWLIPISSLFWANVHGGFLAGIGLIVLFASAEFIRRGPLMPFVAVAVVSGLLSMVNPYGLRYWAFLFDATTMDRSAILEWGAMDLSRTEFYFVGFKFLLACSALVMLIRVLRNEIPPLATVLTLAVTAFLGLRVVRHLTFFVIVASPFVWAWLSSIAAGIAATRAARAGLAPPGRRPSFGATWYGLSRGALVLYTFGILGSTPLRIVVLDRLFPERAIDFIENNGLRGNLLVPFNWGSYAIWRLYPGCRVAMDGRYETVYSDATYDAVRSFFLVNPGWSEFLDQLPHDIILAPRADVFVEAMGERTDWVIAHRDDGALVYVRASEKREWTAPPLRPGVDRFSTVGKTRYVTE